MTACSHTWGRCLNSPLFMDLISELGVVARTRGEHPDSYSHAEREWADMVLSEELQAWGVYYAHIWDAVAVGVRPQAIQALRQGRDEDLTRKSYSSLATSGRRCRARSRPPRIARSRSALAGAAPSSTRP